MIQTFFVSDSIFEQTKKAIRQFPSLRFRNNPLWFGHNWEISIKGDVNDMNYFNEVLVKIELYNGSHDENCMWDEPLHNEANTNATWGCGCGYAMFLIENDLE